NIIALTIAATDPDNDALTYSATGLPTGLSIETGTGKITGTIDYAASTGSPYTVTVTVKDPSNASASASFVWTVSNTNRAPSVTNPGTQSGTQGSAIAPLSISASDPDGDTLTYGAAGLPGGLSINTTTGVISGTVATNAAATNNVTVTVSDGKGG